MSAIRPEIKEFEKRVCASLRKHGVQIDYINGYVLCRDTITDELVIFNKYAWDKHLRMSYENYSKQDLKN